jgi:hypothetical protein
VDTRSSCQKLRTRVQELTHMATTKRLAKGTTSIKGSTDTAFHPRFWSSCHVRQNMVERLLTSNPRVINLHLTRIHACFQSSEIDRFLAESAPPAEGGNRIRVNTMNASGTPPGKSSGRKPKGAGSAVPGGHPQPRQNTSVSTPLPQLACPPATAGCWARLIHGWRAAAAPQLEYGPPCT